MEERVAPSLRKTTLQILSEKTKIMSSIKSLFAVFFSLSKTSFLKPNTNIRHKNNIINMESTYLVQPIVNAKKVAVALHRHFTSHRFSLKRPQLSPIKSLFAVLFLSFSLWNYTSFSEITFTFIWFEKRSKDLWRNSCWIPQIICKPQVFTEKTTIVCHQIFICSVIYFFLSFSEITFTFMWWEKQGKV